MNNKRGGKKIVCHSQAFELDVELLHLHFLPRLQLKRQKKRLITANTKVCDERADVECYCNTTLNVLAFLILRLNILYLVDLIYWQIGRKK